MITIFLDNGHGHTTKGKRSPKWDDIPQIFEWSYNRRIVNAIYNKLVAKGYKVVKLVPEIEDISLTERCRRANKIKDAILVSVHLNAFDKSESANGWEIYTSGSTKSKRLAEIFSKNASAFLKNRGVKTGNFTIIKKTYCPAVLTENLFMTNHKDCEYLLSEEGLNNIIDLHVNSIIEYIKKWEPKDFLEIAKTS